MDPFTAELLRVARALGAFERSAVCCGDVTVPQCLLLRDLLVAELAGEPPPDLASLAEGAFDWSSTSISELVEALSLRMDTAFRGDFSDPNDPRIHNSGVAVYGVADLISGLTASGVPMSVTSAPCDRAPSTNAAESSGEDSRQSRPTAMRRAPR